MPMPTYMPKYNDLGLYTNNPFFIKNKLKSGNFIKVIPIFRRDQFFFGYNKKRLQAFKNFSFYQNIISFD